MDGQGAGRRVRVELPSWDDAADRAWADRVRWRLAWHHDVPADVWGPALVEAHEARGASGRPVAEIFGDPDDHAALIARERFPLERRAAVDLEGSAPRDRWRVLPLALGWTGVVVSAVLLVSEGWWVGVGVQGLVLAAAVGSAVVAALSALVERHRGELRRSGARWALAAAIAVAGSTAASRLPDGPALFEAPLVATLLLSLGLLVLGLRLVSRAPSPALGPREETPEQWFGRLGGVLRGRHGLSRPEVRLRVDAAREAWRTAGRAHPSEDFGAPEVHALRLVEGSPLPARARERTEAWIFTAVAAVAVWTVVQGATDGDLDRGLLWHTPVAVLTVWITASRWRSVLAREADPDPAGPPT